jgi:hypothetical protein
MNNSGSIGSSSGGLRRASLEGGSGGSGGGGANAAVGAGYFALEKLLGGSDRLAEYELLEEDLLLSTSISSSYDDDEDSKWASSGDEDDLCDLDAIFSEESPSLDDQERYLALREPLFAPSMVESSIVGQAAMISMAGEVPGKEQLPFNRRKIRYFDEVSTAETIAARTYLRSELQRSKNRSVLLVTRNVRKAQVEARRRQRLEKGESIDDLVGPEKETPEEKALLSGIQPFPSEMTPAMSAALLLESLSLNPNESLEGMSKCYDGIVSAGLAVLDAQTPDSATLSPRPEASKPRPRRSEIMAALAPLLITSLEQPSGEVLLLLAKLRRMCGTTRYQRRFVQRVAPALIRPPGGAIWCLRHQNDMEAVFAATELIFDAAFDVFSKGWYERGRMMLADTKRAQTLNTAAQQLRRLSSEPPQDGLMTMNFPAPHGNRRRLLAAGRKGDGVSGASEALAEWEVMAVDRQIRICISSVLSQDWSRTLIHSDIPKPHNRRATVGSGLKHHRMATLPQMSNTEMSPKAIASPRSPNKVLKTPQSPSYVPVPPSSLLEGAENMYNHQNSFHAAHSGVTSDRPVSPPTVSLSTTPPPLQRTNSKEGDSKTPMTPPRSPKSPKPPILDSAMRGTDPPPVLTPVSQRGKHTAKDIVGLSTPTPPNLTPLSPSASSHGSSTGDLVPFKISMASTQSGSPSAMSYRTLTSTASERKRTVAACRALRAQIQRFEDAFIQLHGRPPKGAAERAPLATTYAQYREWKRAIRADAACRIQALFRGFSTRWKLERMNDPRVKRVIKKRAGRAKNADAIMNQISIPVEIGQSDNDRSSPTVSLIPSPASASDSYSASTQSLTPQWATKIARRRSGDRESMITSRGGYSAVSQPSSPSPAPDSALLTLADLQARKRELKQQLKQYDMSFARKHGRMPVKAEKEPIRHLYENYNALKSQISHLEQEGRHATSPMTPSTPTSFPSLGASPGAQLPNSSALPQQRLSPTSQSGSDSGGNSGGEDSPLRFNQIPLRGSGTKLKLPKTAAPPLVSGSGNPINAASTNSTGSAPLANQDLAELKGEKQRLHQMLRAYEKDFYREHKRQVSSFADIKPVASQYRRYKEIKKAIDALQNNSK